MIENTRTCKPERQLKITSYRKLRMKYSTTPKKLVIIITLLHIHISVVKSRTFMESKLYPIHSSQKLTKDLIIFCLGCSDDNVRPLLKVISCRLL